MVNNPAGDSESVDSLSIGFGITGVVVSSITGGNFSGEDPDGDGVSWFLYDPAVAPGASSGWLTFDSDLPPSPGSAQSEISPWYASSTGVNAVPVPGTGNFSVPDSTNTMTLLAGVLLLLPFGAAMRKKASSVY
jgi:hypothetical protein